MFDGMEDGGMRGGPGMRGMPDGIMEQHGGLRSLVSRGIGMRSEQGALPGRNGDMHDFMAGDQRRGRYDGRVVQQGGPAGYDGRVVQGGGPAARHAQQAMQRRSGMD